MMPITSADLALYASGFAMTLTVSALGIAIAVLVGLPMALALRSGRALLVAPVRLYVEFMRGAPLAPVLFLLYYGGPQIGLVLDAATAGVLGLGLYGAGPFAEIFRAGLESVPRGEKEAAAMLGLSRSMTFLHVELPRAVRLILPPSVGQAINLVKESAVLSVITLAELTKVAGAISAVTFAVVTPYVVVSLLYWGFVEAIARLGAFAELHLSSKES